LIQGNRRDHYDYEHQPTQRDVWPMLSHVGADEIDRKVDARKSENNGNEGDRKRSEDDEGASSDAFLADKGIR